MTDQTDTPIAVDASSLPGLIFSNLRVFLVALGAFLAGRGWVGREEFDQYLPVALIVVPWLVGQYRGWRNHRKQVALANMLPDSLAVTK